MSQGWEVPAHFAPSPDDSRLCNAPHAPTISMIFQGFLGTQSSEHLGAQKGQGQELLSWHLSKIMTSGTTETPSAR